MKKEKTIEELFQGMSYISYLHSIPILTLSELINRCVNASNHFVRLAFPDLSSNDMHNVNWAIAKQLCIEGIIAEEEVTKQLTISCYYTVLKKTTRKALFFHGYKTIGELCEDCIKDNEFKLLKGKKTGPRVNYEIAQLLHTVGFLSEEAFAQVPLPHWKIREPIDTEIGEDGNIMVHTVNWSTDAQFVIDHAVGLKFGTWHTIRNRGKTKPWKSITIAELVKTFVRINFCGTSFFYTTVQISSYWHSREWFNKKFEFAFTEIEYQLKQLGYLE